VRLTAMLSSFLVFRKKLPMARSRKAPIQLDSLQMTSFQGSELLLRNDLGFFWSTSRKSRCNEYGWMGGYFDLRWCVGTLSLDEKWKCLNWHQMYSVRLAAVSAQIGTGKRSIFCMKNRSTNMPQTTAVQLDDYHTEHCFFF
jgi:hypothetical protein